MEESKSKKEDSKLKMDRMTTLEIAPKDYEHIYDHKRDSEVKIGTNVDILIPKECSGKLDAGKMVIPDGLRSKEASPPSLLPTDELLRASALKEARLRGVPHTEGTSKDGVDVQYVLLIAFQKKKIDKTDLRPKAKQTTSLKTKETSSPPFKIVLGPEVEGLQLNVKKEKVRSPSLTQCPPSGIQDPSICEPIFPGTMRDASMARRLLKDSDSAKNLKSPRTSPTVKLGSFRAKVASLTATKRPTPVSEKLGSFSAKIASLTAIKKRTPVSEKLGSFSAKVASLTAIKRSTSVSKKPSSTSGKLAFLTDGKGSGSVSDKPTPISGKIALLTSVKRSKDSVSKEAPIPVDVSVSVEVEPIISDTKEAPTSAPKKASKPAKRDIYFHPSASPNRRLKQTQSLPKGLKEGFSRVSKLPPKLYIVKKGKTADKKSSSQTSLEDELEALEAEVTLKPDEEEAPKTTAKIVSKLAEKESYKSETKESFNVIVKKVPKAVEKKESKPAEKEKSKSSSKKPKDKKKGRKRVYTLAPIRPWPEYDQANRKRGKFILKNLSGAFLPVITRARIPEIIELEKELPSLNNLMKAHRLAEVVRDVFIPKKLPEEDSNKPPEIAPKVPAPKTGDEVKPSNGKDKSSNVPKKKKLTSDVKKKKEVSDSKPKKAIKK